MENIPIQYRAELEREEKSEDQLALEDTLDEMNLDEYIESQD